MEQNTTRLTQGDLSLIVRSDWAVGPRTASWDRLWRSMRGGIDARPIADAREQLGREDGDA